MSEMTENRLKDEAFRNHIESSIPMRRVGQTPEIAEAILFLLSAESSFITGAMLDAAGGGYIIYLGARHSSDASCSSGPRASCARMIMSAQDARGPKEKRRRLRRLDSSC